MPEEWQQLNSTPNRMTNSLQPVHQPLSTQLNSTPRRKTSSLQPVHQPLPTQLNTTPRRMTSSLQPAHQTPPNSAQQHPQVGGQFIAASPPISSRVRNKGVTQVMMTYTLYPHLLSLKLQESGKDQEDCSTSPCPPIVTQPAYVDMFLLVEVANPHYGINGEGRIMKVYCHWSDSDFTKACKSLGDPKADPAQLVLNP